MSWTFKDEMELRAAEDRAQHLHRVRSAAVRNVEERFLQALDMDKLEGVDWARVIAHSEMLRDALAPFDSGTREAPAVPEPTPIPTAGYPGEWAGQRPVCGHD